MIARILIVLALVVTGCSEDKELSPRPFARMETLPVDGITSEGATLRGAIKLLNVPLLEYGFHISKHQFFMSSLVVLKVDAPGSVGEFELRLTQEMVEGVKYYVRAFAQTEGFTSYGETVEFVSLGSKAPIVTSLSDAEGLWGDQVVIYGSNFSTVTSNMKVTFDGITSTIVKSTPDSVVCRVPSTLGKSPATVEVSVFGNAAKLENAFALRTPEITSVSPTTGGVGTVVTITGKYFNPGTTRVKIGMLEITPNKITSAAITMTVPEGVVAGEQVLKVVTAEGNGSAEATFLAIVPTITNVSPLTGTYDDLVTISLENWTSEEVIVYFGDHLVPIVSANQSTITVRVVDMPVAVNEVKIRLGGKLVTSGINFSLLPAEITSVTQEDVFSGRVLIKGARFSSNYTQVFVDGTFAPLGHLSSDEIAFHLPEVSDHLVTVEVFSSGQGTTAQDKISVPVAKLPSFSNLPRQRLFSIGDDFYATSWMNSQTVLLKYNYSSGEWISRNSPPFASSMGATFSIGGTLYWIDDSMYQENHILYSYDTSNDTWFSLGAVPFELYDTKGISLNGFGYVLGGHQYGSGRSEEVWRFDPMERSWDLMQGTIQGLSDHRPFIAHGLIYSFLESGAMVRYDPATDTWTQVSNNSLDGLIYVAHLNNTFYFMGIYGEMFRFNLDTNQLTYLTSENIFSHAFLGERIDARHAIYFVREDFEMYILDASRLEP